MTNKVLITTSQGTEVFWGILEDWSLKDSCVSILLEDGDGNAEVRIVYLPHFISISTETVK